MIVADAHDITARQARPVAIRGAPCTPRPRGRAAPKVIAESRPVETCILSAAISSSRLKPSRAIAAVGRPQRARLFADTSHGDVTPRGEGEEYRRRFAKGASRSPLPAWHGEQRRLLTRFPARPTFAASPPAVIGRSAGKETSRDTDDAPRSPVRSSSPCRLTLLRQQHGTSGWATERRRRQGDQVRPMPPTPPIAAAFMTGLYYFVTNVEDASCTPR